MTDDLDENPTSLSAPEDQAALHLAVTTSFISVEGVVLMLRYWLSRAQGPLTVQWRVSPRMHANVRQTCLRWDMPWSAVTEWTYATKRGESDMNAEWVLSHISRLNSIVCLRVEGMHLGHDTSPANLSVIRLPSLRKLFIRDTTHQCLTVLLQTLVCPELEGLFIFFPESRLSWTEDIHTLFLKFISHCSGSLNTLTFNVNAYNFQDVHSFLPSLPSLTWLNWIPLTPASSQLLTLHYANDGHLESGACPRLARFLMFPKLRERPVVTPVLDVFNSSLWSNIVDMLESRFKAPENAVDDEGQPVHPIEKVTLFVNSGDYGWWKEVQPRERSRLETLRAEGFVVEFKTGMTLLEASSRLSSCIADIDIQVY